MRFLFSGILLLTAFVSGVQAATGDDARATALLANVQVRSQQLALLANDASGGKVEAFLDLDAARKRIGAALTQLKQGDARTGFSGLAGRASLSAELLGVDKAWAPLDANVTKILQRQPQIIGSRTAVDDFDAKAARLNAHTDEIVKTLVDGHGSKLQVKLAAYQMLLIERMQRRAHAVLDGGEDAANAATGLQRDRTFYGAVIASLLDGNPDLDLKAIDDAAARGILQDMNTQWDELAPAIATLLDAAAALQEVRKAADDIRLGSETLLARSEPLQQHLGQ